MQFSFFLTQDLTQPRWVHTHYVAKAITELLIFCFYLPNTIITEVSTMASICDTRGQKQGFIMLSKYDQLSYFLSLHGLFLKY